VIIKPSSKGGALDREGNPRRNKGGRPPSPWKEKRRIDGGDNHGRTNRRAAHQKRKRNDIGASEMLKMAQYMKSMLPLYKDMKKYWAHNRGKFPQCSKDRLKKIRDNEANAFRRNLIK